MTASGTFPSIRRITLLALALAGAVALAPGAAHAQDDFLSRANNLYASYRQDKRSDLIILPAIQNMDPVPAGAEEGANAILLPVTSSRWPEIEQWAMAPGQRAALEALAKVTEDEGPQTHMVFAQPYGTEGVPIDLVIAELYTELGDPPSLAGAEFLYFEGIEKLWTLAHVEANRLIAAGEGPAAMEVLFDWLFFARQLADREMAPEKMVGMVMMQAALEHIRDIAYQDFRAQSHSLTPSVLTELVQRLDDKRGALGIERLLLPRADLPAVEQLLHRIYDQQTRKPDPARYSTVMAGIASQERPLRLFSEAAKWDAIRMAAADWYTITDTLRNVANDFERRWGLSFRDPVMALTSDYEKNVQGKPGMAPIAARYEMYPEFFKLRQDLFVEAGGTRMALAMYGFSLQQNTFPRDLSAVRPNFARTIDMDPYSASSKGYSFFVPIRDQPKGPRGEPAPRHEMRVFPGGIYALEGVAENFAVTLGEDQFVIYSVGPDESRDWAKDVTQAQEDYRTGDYLIWPPVTSLLRTHLVQQGRLD